jgi:GNAT superfamily N-acetyltransferase
MTLNDGMTVHYGATRDEIDFVWNGIIEYNKTTGPMLEYPPYERFDVLVRNDHGEIVAGVLSKMYLRSVFVEVLWVSESLRKKGIGSKLLHEVECCIKEKGCRMIHLDTFSFQAIDFYLRLGYSVFGTIEDYPDGIKRYYLKKRL